MVEVVTFETGRLIKRTTAPKPPVRSRPIPDTYRYVLIAELVLLRAKPAAQTQLQNSFIFDRSNLSMMLSQSGQEGLEAVEGLHNGSWRLFYKRGAYSLRFGDPGLALNNLIRVLTRPCHRAKAARPALYV